MSDLVTPAHFDPLATGKQGAEQFAALVAQEQAKINGTPVSSNVEAFDRDMQAAGIQQRVASDASTVDQTAVDYLNSWLRENPNATAQQLETWNRDMQQIEAGRRFGETPQAFEQRQLDGSGFELDSPEAVVRVADVGESLGVARDTVESIIRETALSVVRANGESLPEKWTQDRFELNGYAIDPREMGLQIDRHSAELYHASNAARARGVTQEQFVRMLAAFFDSEA
jgi:hypothetical protein